MALKAPPPAPPNAITSLAIVVEPVATAETPLPPAAKINIERFLTLNQTATELREKTIGGVTRAAFERQLKLAPREAEQAVEPFGFYEPEISVEAFGEAERRRVAISIDPGPQVLLGSVALALEGPGAEQPELKSLLANTPLQAGEPLDHALYEASKQALQSTALALGYLDAAFSTARLEIHPAEQRADVALTFATGERYRFGAIEVDQDILRESFVDRLVAVESGSHFDVSELIDLQLLMNDTDYFSNVTIDADKEAADNYAVPVVVHTEPQASQGYRVGLGFGTDTGPRMTLGMDLRRLNRRGHQFSVDLRASAIRNTLAAEYRIPIKNVASDRFKLFARLDQAEIGDADSDQFSVGAIREDSWLGLRRQLYLKYNGERFSFGSEPSKDSRLLISGGSLSYQRADDPLFVRRGFAASIDAHGGVDSLASDTTFFSTTFSVHAVRPLGPKSRLLLRGDLGYLEVDDFGALPPGERFFTGGDRTVRGYSFQSLAPENADGDAIGGTTLSAVSAEVDYRAFGNVGVAAFVDHGAASTSFGSDQSTGVGLGLRYRSPVGMIRVDFAHPLDDDDRSVRLHLTLGSDL